MVIQALAPYYSTDTRVKDAVDSGLAVLKSRQECTGGFSSSGSYNAESTAQVIVALTALGIDPTKWTNADPIDALLHFYNSKSAMFRHSVNGADDQMATEQSAYALVAYRRFVMNQNRLYDMSDAFGDDSGVTDAQQAVSDAKMEISSLGTPNIPMTIANTAEDVKNYFTDTWLKMVTTKGPTYEVSIVEGEISAGGFYPAQAGTEAAPDGVFGRYIAYVTITMGEVSDTVRISGSIVPTAYVAPKEDITVSFELLGDMHHTITDDSDIHSYRFNADELPVWIKTVEVTVPGGSTVGDVFKKVMDERGFTYEGLAQGYISSIDNPNDTEKALTEKDTGNDAGWMYLVNGTHPSINLNGYELTGGEVITWHWTDDYRIEEGSEHWSAPRVAEYVENLIKLIGEVDASDACKARIDQARTAYDKLNLEEQSRIKNYQTLLDAEETYLNLAGLDAIVPLVKGKTWTIPMNDANNAADVKTWLEAKLNAMDLKGAKVTVTITALTSATAGIEGKDGADGSFTFTIVLTIGEGDTMDSRVLTGQTGTITANKILPEDFGVASVFVDGKPGKLDDGTITVVLDYLADEEGNLLPVPATPSIDITLSDPKAKVSTPNSTDEGVTWTFTVTSQTGTSMQYMINVSRAASALEANQAAVDAAKSMLDNADFSETLKGITDEAAAKAAVEAQIGALLKDAVSYTVSNISFTPASDGKTGEFTFTVDLTVGEEGSADAATGTSKQDGTIEATEHIASTNAGVTAIKVAGVDAKILGNSFAVTVPYGTEVTASLFEITLADSNATVTTSPHEENGVWSFTVTAEDGSTTATYTVTVTIGKNPDQVKADEVIGLIDNIGTVTLDSKAKIDAAREAYEGLTEAQKELVKNYQTLEKAEARYAELLNDENAAKNVIDLINDIGTVTTDSKAKIDAAREAYSKLTEAQKKLVSNYQVLEKAEADYAKLVADKADQDAADAVIDLINGIGTVTKDSGDTINAARKAYDALTPEQKELVTKKAYETLVKAEKLFDMIQNSGKTDSSSSGVIKISATGATKGEKNPNTGAEVSIAPAMLVLAAAALVLKKRG